MAVSSINVKGFQSFKNYFGVDVPNEDLFIIENSSKIVVGDAVRLDTNGCIKECASTDPAILGIVAGIYDQTGQVGVFSPRIAGAAIAGATLTPDDTVITASDNRTNGLKKLSAYVILDFCGQTGYFNAGNTSVALSQANIGQFFNLSSTNAGQIDTNTASSTSGQFQLLAINPKANGNTNEGIFRIAQSQLVNNFSGYGSSAVITA